MSLKRSWKVTEKSLNFTSSKYQQPHIMHKFIKVSAPLLLQTPFEQHKECYHWKPTDYLKIWWTFTKMESSHQKSKSFLWRWSNFLNLVFHCSCTFAGWIILVRKLCYFEIIQIYLMFSKMLQLRKIKWIKIVMFLLMLKN